MFACGILTRETFDLLPRLGRGWDYAALALLVASFGVIGLTGQPEFAAISGPVLHHSGFELGLLFLSVYAVSCCALAGKDCFPFGSAGTGFAGWEI